MDVGKSPVGVLEKAGCLTVIRTPETVGMTVIHGVSWDDESIPHPVKGRVNVLLGHVSVFGQIPFYWKGDGYTPKTLKEKYPGFDLYLCGDIHDPLVSDNVVVSGSMMRMDIGQLNHTPRYYKVDLAPVKIIPVFYSLESEVFAVKVDTPEVEGLDVSRLVEALKASAQGRADYKRDCLTLAEGDTPVSNLLGEMFDEFS